MTVLSRKTLTVRRSVEIIATVTISMTIISGVVMHFTDEKTYPNIGDGLWWAIQTVMAGWQAHLPQRRRRGSSKLTVAKGHERSILFASEEKFPELVNPVQMAFDTKGRLWVPRLAGSYPHWKPKDEMNDKLLILEDTDGDGVADKCTTFADSSALSDRFRVLERTEC